MNNILKKLSAARLVLMTLLVGSAASAAAADQVYISDFGIKAGEVKEIAINFDTDATDIQYLEGNIQLPAGLVLVNDAYGTNRRVKGESSRNADSNGNMNPGTGDFIVTSTGKFTGTEGAVAYLTVKTNRYLKEISKIHLSGLNAVKADGTKVPVADFTTTVTRTTALAWLAYVKDTLAVVGGEEADVEVDMTNVVDVTLLQAKLSVEKGLTIKEVKASKRASGVEYNPATGMVIVNIKKDQPLEDRDDVAGAKGVLFTIKVLADKGFMGKSKVHVDSPVASETNADTHKPEAIALDVTIRDAELKAKCDSISKDASSQLEAALTHIAERDTDVVKKYEKESMPIGQQLVQLQRNIETAYQDLSLKEKDVKEAADKIAAAIKALQDAADAEQKQIEEERAKKAANDAAYKKLSDELAALQAQLDAAKAAIAEGDKDVAKDFEETLNGIQKQLDDAKKALDDKNANTELTADSKLEGVDGVPAAIEKAKADADAAQKAYEEEQAKIAANEANYKAIKAVFEAAQQQLDAAKKHIEENDSNVADNFAGRLQELQDTLNTGSAIIDSLYKAVALAEVDSSQMGRLDDFAAALEQLVKDADAAQKTYEAIAANEANYAKIIAEFTKAQELLDGVKKHIADECSDVAADFADRIAALQDSIDTGRAIIDKLYEAVALINPESGEHMGNFIVAIAQLQADADAAQEAKLAKNQTNYDMIKGVFDAAQEQLDGVKKHIDEECPNVAKDFADRLNELQDVLDYGRAAIDSLYQAVALAEVDSSQEAGRMDEFVGKLEQLKKDADAAEQAWIIAHQKIFEEGVYYLQNVATGKFLAAGHSWGTQAIVSEDGLDFTAAFTPEGKYTFDSNVSNGGNSHFLGSNLYTDAGAFGWTVAEVSKGVYTLSDGQQFAGVDADDNIVWHAESCDSAQWKLVTYAERVKALENARVANPLNATFMVKDAGFNRNDLRKSAWTGDDFSVNGDATNTNAEKWGGNSQTFDIKQTVEVPNGVYKITWNGFYRYNNTTENTNDVAVAAHADGTEVINSFVYINDKDYALTSIADDAASAALEGKIPFSQGDASAAFGQGLYAQEADVLVTDGQLTIGIKKTEHPGTDWTVWDNFRLTYMGPEQSVADGDYYLQNVATGKFLAAGHSWGTQAIVNADGLDFTLTMANDGKYSLDSKVSNGGNSHFLGSNLYTDAAAYGWSVEKVRDGLFMIGDGEKYLGVNADDNLELVEGSNETATWKFVIYEERVKDLEGATKADPKNATFMVKDAGFNRNDLRKSAWTGDDFSVNGDATNTNAEKWGGNSQTFDIKQTVEVPNGVYKITWNGFYRYNNTTENTNDVAVAAHADGTEVINSFVYINDKDYALTSIADDAASAALEGKIPFSQGDASAAFGQGLYEQSAEVVVTDGQLTIGIKKTEHLGTDWTVWDNFRLTYKGVATNPDDPELEAPTGWLAVIKNGNLAGEEVSNFFIKENGGAPVPAVIVDGAGKNNSRGIIVNTPDAPGTDWDAQFFIQADQTIPAGSKIHVEFDYMASQEAGFDTQSHAAPGDYIHWYCVGSETATTEWKHHSAEVEVSQANDDGSGEWGKACTNEKNGKAFQTVAFNLSKVKTATTFHFDNIIFWIQTPDMVGIENVTLKVNDGAVYDLRGRKVEGALRKGIYIQNGKKIMMK